MMFVLLHDISPSPYLLSAGRSFSTEKHSVIDITIRDLELRSHPATVQTFILRLLAISQQLQCLPRKTRSGPAPTVASRVTGFMNAGQKQATTAKAITTTTITTVTITTTKTIKTTVGIAIFVVAKTIGQHIAQRSKRRAPEVPPGFSRLLPGRFLRHNSKPYGVNGATQVSTPPLAVKTPIRRLR
jgi:hypothetical protein